MSTRGKNGRFFTGCRAPLWLLGLAIALALAGCKPAAEAAQAPALAAPTEAPPAVVSATLDDLAGWWKTSLSMDATLHVEPDGTYREFGYKTEQGAVVRGGEPRGSWRPNEENHWELRRIHGPMDPSCRNTAGIHDIEILSADSLRTLRIEDPCTYVSTDEVTWTRATQLEKLLGIWVAEGEEDATVAFYGDLTYAAWHGASAQEGAVVRGEVGWNQPLQQLELKDKAPSPCRASIFGKYTLAFDADGVLTIACAEDLCAERKAVLTEWGPFHRQTDYVAFAGRYVGVEEPAYELLLTSCGTQRLRQMPDEGEGLLHEGSYALVAEEIAFVDTWGEEKCPQTVGTYAYTLSDDTLTLTALSDGCAARAKRLGACPTWTRTRAD